MDVLESGVRGELAEEKARGSNVNDGELGDDVVDDFDAREWEGAFFKDFRFVVSRGVLHGNEDALGAGHQVHRAAHAFEHFAGNGPVRERSLFVDLQRAENREIDVATANHGKRIGGRKISSAWQLSDGFFARVDEVGIDFGFERIRANAEHAVFGLQDDVHSFRDVVGDKRGHADAEIDVVAIAEFEGDAAGDAFAFLIVSQWHEVLNGKPTTFS